MAKLTLNNVANGGPTGVTSINANSDLIEAAIENTLSRDGTSPNQMNADLDMNNNDILNVAELNVDSLTIDGVPIGSFSGTFQGLWDSGTEYVVNDVVRDASGNLWIALRTTINDTPVEGDDWTLFMPGATVADDSVSTVKIQDGAVTEAKVATALLNKLIVNVATKTDLRAVDTADYTNAYLNHNTEYGIFKWKSGDQSANTVLSSQTTTSADGTTDTFTKTDHGLVTMVPIVVTAAVSVFAINTVYWVIRTGANTFKLASSMANARAGTAIDFTGTGNITLKVLKDPYQGVYVIPTGSNLDGTQGVWERQTDQLVIRYLGAIGDNSTDDVEAFQHASNYGGRWRIENKSYRITTGISFYKNGYGLVGNGMYRSIINYVATSGNAFYNPWFGTTTMVEGTYWGDLQLTAASLTSAGSIIALKNVQRWTTERVYFYGAQITGTYCIDAQGIWPLGTYYGQAKACIFGLCTFGIYGGDGFNNNRLEDCRFQQASPGGAQGITLLPTVAGYSSVTRIEHCSFELPGNTMTGIYANNATGVTVDDCRFESLLLGMNLLSSMAHVEVRNPYFESCTTKITNTSTELQSVVRAAGTFNGVAGVSITGKQFGCTIARGSTGVYTVTFTNAFAVADYQLSVTVAGQFSWNIAAGGQLTTAITFETRNAGVLADVGNINFVVIGPPA